MSFNKLGAIAILSAESMPPLVCRDLELEVGELTESLSWCRATAACLAYSGIAASVSGCKLRFVNPITNVPVSLYVDSKETGIANQVVIEHSNPKTPLDGKFTRMSWCTPLEAAIIAIATL
jgi:hypothetical protein